MSLSSFALESVVTPRRLRCIIIGAGMSGIFMVYKLKKYLPDAVEVVILEKSPELGGTWYENRYPGCACDVPSHVYQFPFAPNPDWSKFYATSGEIQRYMKSVCSLFGLDSHMVFSTRVTSAQWQEDHGVWTITTEGATAGGVYECEILINAGGILNNYSMPDISGLADFKGPIVHTAAWDDTVDLADKRVAIIGAGASAVQVLPAIQPLCKSIDIYIQTPSWVSPPVGLDPDRANGAPNPKYTQAERDAFRQDTAHFLQTRKGMESKFNDSFAAFFKAGTEQHGMRARYEAYMRGLIHDAELQEKLIPGFEAGCRRVNPSQAYLAAVQETNVRPVFDSIIRIVPDGVEVQAKPSTAEQSTTAAVHSADVIIAATGFDTSFKPRFPILGRGGVDLRLLWDSNPVSYMGTGVSGFPNYLTFLGPNTPISNGSLTGPIEATADYFVRLIGKAVRERVKSFEPSFEAQHEFYMFAQKYMKSMVWTGTCRSWFKKGIDGPVSALWPGSALHYMQTLAEDRWHDYTWTFRENRFAHWERGFSWLQAPELDPLGMGLADARINMTTIPRKGDDLAFYLVDHPPLPVSNTQEKSEPRINGTNAQLDLELEETGIGAPTHDMSGLQEYTPVVPV
ncbi:FAD/NAD(P)-binding domain-containing protein [Thozetella sp. PMI_491]|nr:FAD/NAD(P)-binding domain-containing protein [Thozetella sp. PMI_491]